MSGHNINGGSALHRRVLCPGSANAEQGLPDPDSEYSLQGTAAHEVGAACLLDPSKRPVDWLNEVVLVDKADGSQSARIMTKDDLEAVEVYVDYVNRRRAEIEETQPSGIEVRVDPGPWWGHRDDTKGTADCILYGVNVTEVIDYKHGAGVSVDVVENDQGMSYATGVATTVDWSKMGSEHNIRITVVQPRCPHPDGPVRSWDITPYDLYQRAKGYEAALTAGDDPDAPRIPGEKQCRFCKAKGDCPALAAEALSVFQPVDRGTEEAITRTEREWDAALAAIPAAAIPAAAIPAAATPAAAIPAAAIPAAAIPEAQREWDDLESVLLRPVDHLSPDQISQVLDKAPLMRTWLKNLEARGLEVAQSGTDIQGYKVVLTNPQRKYDIDGAEVIKKLSGMKDRDGKKLPKASCQKVVPLTFTEAEKRIKPLVSERTWKNFDKHIIKPKGSPVLVPVTDPREAVKSAEQVFEKQEPVYEAPSWD